MRRHAGCIPLNPLVETYLYGEIPQDLDEVLDLVECNVDVGGILPEVYAHLNQGFKLILSVL